MARWYYARGAANLPLCRLRLSGLTERPARGDAARTSWMAVESAENRGPSAANDSYEAAPQNGAP
jgi:hypothetical protein